MCLQKGCKYATTTMHTIVCVCVCLCDHFSCDRDLDKSRNANRLFGRKAHAHTEAQVGAQVQGQKKESRQDNYLPKMPEK